MARKDYYDTIGHNFLASDTRDMIEHDMKDFTQTLQLVSTLGVDLSQMRADPRYQQITEQLTKDYENSYTQFKSQRKNLATKYFIGGALSSMLAKLGIDQLFEVTGRGEGISKWLGKDGVEVGEREIGSGSDAPGL